VRKAVAVRIFAAQPAGSIAPAIAIATPPSTSSATDATP
jgi:hypothetical protein